MRTEYVNLIKNVLKEQKTKDVYDQLEKARDRQSTPIKATPPEGFDGVAEVHTVKQDDNEMILSLTPSYKNFKELWVDIEDNYLVVRGFSKTGQKKEVIGKEKVKRDFKVLRDLYSDELTEFLRKKINYKLEDF
jgi:hypothetical protein